MNNEKKRQKQKKDGKRILAAGAAAIAAFAVWTVLIMAADVKPIGQNGTTVGFAAVNTWFFNFTDVNLTLCEITDWLGIMPIIVCAVFGVIGLRQLIERRSLHSLDLDIVLLRAYYCAFILCYIVFEQLPINYRSIPINGGLEISYPSSTTMLVLSVMPTLSFKAKRRVKSVTATKIIETASTAFPAVTVIGRLISGVHWLTDIFGGILLSVGLFLIYNGTVLSIENYNDSAGITFGIL